MSAAQAPRPTLVDLLHRRPDLRVVPLAAVLDDARRQA